MSSPFTQKDCDLRDFQFMPMDVRRLLTSETWVTGSADDKCAAMSLWLESWHQVPAASIPNNDKMLAHLSGAGGKWAKVKAHVLRGWRDGGDGRLYHPVVAEKALEAWIEKLSSAISGNAGNAKRWGIDIDSTGLHESLRHAVEQLKTIAPRSKTLNKKTAKIVESRSPPDSGSDRNRQGQGQGQRQRERAAAREANADAGESPEEYLDRIAAAPADNRRMVPMTDGWQPCEKFEDQARISGIDPELLTSDALAKFRIFYDGQERLANRWNLALIDWLKRERPANVADIRAAKPKPVEKKTEYWTPDPKRMMTEEELAVLHAGRALLK